MITWNQAAAEALRIITHTPPTQKLTEASDFKIVEAYDHGLRLIFGAWARNDLDVSDDSILELLASKQRDYGHENILRFGVTGLDVRLWDKLARFMNLRSSGHNPENESLQDTLMDIVGYTVIREMLDRGWFTLELEPVE